MSFEAWVGTRGSGVALFVLALVVFALESIVLPVHPGRDMGRYVQSFLQLGYETPVLPDVINARGPLAALGVGGPLEAGGWAAEAWLGVLYAASIVAWGAVARIFGPRAAVLTSGLLLVYPGYGILFHALASDSLFAAAFAGWAVLLSRAIMAPSTKAWLFAGLGMGVLVLVRPANQVLIVFALLPLLLRAPWARRLTWVAAFFLASTVLTQGWLALKYLRYGETVAARPSGAVLVTALVLVPFLFPAPWRRRLVLLAVLAVIGVAAVEGPSVEHPGRYTRSLTQAPPSTVFLFRAFEIDHIISPDNGPASQLMARVVQRELLAKEPYRSYGVSLDEFFSSGSDRMFQDLQGLGGIDQQAVTEEAIRRHWRTLATGITRTTWEMLWTRRVYATVDADAGNQSSGEDQRSSGLPTSDFIVVNGRRLPRPSGGDLIPASRFGHPILTIKGQAQEVWRSPTEHPLVFDDPLDQRRYQKFERATDRLSERIPTRGAIGGLVHRLNQLSHVFPPPLVWLVVGLVGLGVRRPRRLLVALAPAVAGLVVIVGTSLVAVAVGEYAAPVSAAFMLLAAVGLVGATTQGDRLSRQDLQRSDRSRS